MRKRSLKIGLVALTTALSAGVPLLAAHPAFADYAPNSADTVGVGSDTLQYMFDFLADGDGSGTSGYNSLGNKYKLVNIDATADDNARLAYGVNGAAVLGTGNFICTPGTGSSQGTGNNPSTHGDAQPCALNPMVTLRSGFQPVQRPNGSGAGFKALVQDILNPSPVGEIINYSRASSAQHPAAIIGNCGTSTVPCLDSITVGNESVPLLVASTTNAPTNGTVPLSTTALNNIYTATTTGTNAYGQPGCVKWNQIPGNTTGSATTILPIIPQVGSGTRSFFLSAIGASSTLPTSNVCYTTGEENDPTAIAQAATPADAIEPMSQGRLNLFQGKNSGGISLGVPGTGYFDDPSCPFNADTAACDTLTSATTLSAALSTASAITSLPVAATTSNIGANVNLVVTDGATHNQVFKTSAATTTGATSLPVYSTTPNFAYAIGAAVDTNPVVKAVLPSVKGVPTTGTSPDGLAIYGGSTASRNLYMYFRNSDIASTTPFQPGTTENWLNTLFYDPCQTGAVGCQTIGGVVYGPGGQPYIDINNVPVSDAGIVPVDPNATGNFQSGGA